MRIAILWSILKARLPTNQKYSGSLPKTLLRFSFFSPKQKMQAKTICQNNDIFAERKL